MKHIFVDTNVVIDFLTEREPFVESASILFTLAGQGAIKTYISSLSFTNLYYVVRKVAGREKALKLLKDLKIITIVLEVNSIYY